MAMPRRRPLEDPNQYYAYVWRLDGVVIWVGQGKNNRGRPACRASWSGRPAALLDELRARCQDVAVQIFPCDTKAESVEKERVLIKCLKPRYNTAPHKGGWKGMHTPAGLAKISAANSGRPVSEQLRQARQARMMGNTNLLGHKHSDETKAKLSAAGRARQPMSDEVRERMRIAAIAREAKKRRDRNALDL